jgi:hypothetical protein
MCGIPGMGQGGPHPLGAAARQMMGGGTPPPETWQRAGGSPQMGQMPQPTDIRAPQMVNPAAGQPPVADVLPAAAGPVAPRSGGAYINGPR